jgi:hypothetical protein
LLHVTDAGSSGGNRRFNHDAGLVKPTLVLVNFGMNDGHHPPFTAGR